VDVNEYDKMKKVKEKIKNDLFEKFLKANISEKGGVSALRELVEGRIEDEDTIKKFARKLQ
jgi:hypothetical protein